MINTNESNLIGRVIEFFSLSKKYTGAIIDVYITHPQGMRYVVQLTDTEEDGRNVRTVGPDSIHFIYPEHTRYEDIVIRKETLFGYQQPPTHQY